MGKCIICGRELTTGEPLEMYNGMCVKCHIEQNFAEYPFKQGIYDYQQQIDQLKQQLEEKDQQIKKRVMVYEKQFIVQTNEIYSLKQQLAEKQNEIDEINKEFVQAVHDWKELCKKKDKEIENCKRNELYEENMKILAVKNRTQLAIQELEKVKNFVDGRTYCANYIKKRIKELKGEKDDAGK